jgi:hypothetical protein
MSPNDIHEASWMFRFLVDAVEWLNPAVCVVGLGIAVWAFLRCRKWGYLVVTIYFALSVFTLLAMPSINRVIRAHGAPDYSAQTQQKIDAAVQEAIHKVLVEDGHPYGIPKKRTIRFPFGPILLVVGLWLLARRETRRPNVDTGCKSELEI